MTASMALACSPSTFEGLVGGEEKKPPQAPATDKEPRNTAGTTTDDALAPPRPIAPLSVTWVNTLRPKFRWAPTDGEVGAVVELSRTRKFEKVEHRFVGTGTDVIADADVAPGIWFWRLKGRTTGSEGSKASPVWEVLVRTPSNAAIKDAPLDAPTGGVLDMNGDGIPDLAMTYEALPMQAGDPNVIAGVVFMGHADGTFTIEEDQGIAFYAEALTNPITGGIDLDGDGFGDLATSGIYTIYDQDGQATSEKGGGVLLYHGGPDGYNDAADLAQPELYIPNNTSYVTPISAIGDVNGDGFGDVGVQYPGLGFVGLGSARGGSSMMIFANDEDPKGPLLTLAGGVDFDGDGFSDVVSSSTIASSPIRFTRGDVNRFKSLSTLALALPPASIPSRAIAVTSGDFDGNGKLDIAFSTVISAQAAVCIYTPNAGALTIDNCSLSGTADDVATDLVAGDLNHDGIDDLVATSGKGNVTALVRSATGFTPEAIGGGFGPHVTMIHPGRGGGADDDARWAALGADGQSFYIYKGTKPIQTLVITGHKFLRKLGPSIR